jgi:uncharacterized protein YidB (DUF937 family)
MVALLGLLAVAGYQNREKIAEALGSLGQKGTGSSGGLSGGSLESTSGASLGSILSGGLGSLIESFQQAGQGKLADSWVQTGPNEPVRTEQLEQAIGEDVITTLVERTGLSREELLSRLTTALPKAVDSFTPDGRIPTEQEASRFASF